jgi:Na+/melibiose symporter-like transporter
LKDFVVASGNENFRKTIGTKLAFGICAGTHTTLGLYMGTYFWEFSTEQLGGLVIPMLFAALTAFAALNWLGKRFDKPRLISWVCLGFGLNALWFVGLRLLGVLPENGHPVLYALLWLTTYIGVFFIVSLQVLAASLLADILDEQQLRTGQRQEGVFFAASAFVLKASTGVGNLAGGVVIDMAGLPPGAEPGTVPLDVLNILGWCSGPGVAVCGIIAWLYARRVRLSRASLEGIRRELAVVQ